MLYFAFSMFDYFNPFLSILFTLSSFFTIPATLLFAQNPPILKSFYTPNPKIDFFRKVQLKSL